MKLLIVLALSFLMSAPAEARLFGGGDSSGGGSRVTWETIIENYKDYVPQFKRVRFKKTTRKITEICLVPELGQFRTKERVLQPELYLDRDFSYTDVEYESSECVRYRGRHCIRDIVMRKYPINYKIEVLGPARGDRSFGPLLFKKNFEVKDCQD
ncbi:MAG: hypothetical protein HN509_16135 [Halobacteriovoraceae bacterium]|jgi:hypothetical protein|nr:hypothetical protein [Halobacteriovoraceae bacterium]MBT5094365.1 hypothetical protein [Halobacteriovoraceae bacterium]